jgi:hypothetical protein
VPPEAVKFTAPPKQVGLLLLADALGGALTVTVVLAVLLQALASVTVTT